MTVLLLHQIFNTTVVLRTHRHFTHIINILSWFHKNLQELKECFGYFSRYLKDKDRLNDKFINDHKVQLKDLL